MKNVWEPALGYDNLTWGAFLTEVSTEAGPFLSKHAKDIDVNILQVPPRGSSTSSRLEFLKAVSPK